MASTFGWVDYMVVGCVLLISAIIGMYHSFRRAPQNTDDYLLGGRKLALFPVACSVMVSFLSAVSLVAVPADVYYFGASFWVNSFSYLISVPVTAHVFIPIFYRLRLRSVYEYLEIRFFYGVRLLASLMFTLQMILYMALVSYAPAIVFSQVSEMSLWVSITVMGTLVTVYTTLGGLKAVVWTDMFQICIIIAGLLMLLIQGIIEAEGFQKVWDLATEGNRLDNVFNFDPDPLVRHTVWSLFIGGSFTTLSVYAVNQAMVQRYLSVRSLKEAQCTIYFNLPGNIIMTTLLTGVGLVTYAKYKGCDPLLAKRVERPDQIIPLYVMDVMGHIPGLGGLFIACVFCAALSTVSSGLNALALVQLEDIANPIYRAVTGTTMPDKLSNIVSKLLAVSLGGLTVGLAFVVAKLDKTMLTITINTFSMTGGPLLGLFLFAIFVPFANSLGAILGMLSGLAFSTTLVVGTAVQRINPPILKITKALCPAVNKSGSVTVVTPTYMATVLSNVTTIMKPKAVPTRNFFHLSYMWYSTYAVLITIVVGILISLATGGWKHQEDDPDLVINLYRKIRKLVRGHKDDENRDERVNVVSHDLPEMEGNRREN